MNKKSTERAILEAHKNPNGWVYDIDYLYKKDDRIPSEAILGAWEVDESGNLTSIYKVNENYRPVIEKEKVLPQYMHSVAKFCQNQWIAEVKREYENLFPRYPDDAILGYWYVDQDGTITKKFRPTKYFIE